MISNAPGHLRKTVTVTVVAAATAALAGFGVVSNVQAEQATELHHTALHAVQTEARLAGQLVASAKQVRTDGRAAIAAAKGKTLTIEETAAAEKHLVALDKATRGLTSAAAAARKSVHDHAGADVAYWRLGALDDRLGKVTLAPERTAFLTAKSDVSTDKQRLADAVTAWQKEQDRIAAEKAAAAKAAEEWAVAAARAATAAAATTSRPASGRTGTTAAAPSQPGGAAASASAATPAAAPAAQSKLAIAQAVFARYGFSNVTYGPGVAMGHYGATSLDAQHIYIDLDRIPTARVASVAIHEYQHIKQAQMYGGYDAVVAHYGSVIAMERAADQMARADGATWTNYA